MQQLSIYDEMFSKFKIDKPVRLIELFAGIGSQHQALLNIGVPHEVVAISEIDKYCLKSYEALHGKPNNLGNICDIEKLPKADLWTYSFPCQDCSIAGKLAGLKEGTRSGLLWEVERLLNVANNDGSLPKFLLLENVKNLVSKRFINDFNKWLDFLSSLGYTNYWRVLNAKDYGIPQNRERVFCVSILGDHTPYSFPEKQELKLKLKDLLEDEVDEKYYLSQKMINCFLSDGTNGYPRRELFLGNINRKNQDIGRAVTTLAGCRPTDNFVVEKFGIAPTVTENHEQVTAIAIKNNTKQGYLMAEEGDAVDISGRMKWHKGVVHKGISQTITTVGGNDIGVVTKEAYTDLEKKLFTEDGNVRRYVGSDKVDEFKEGQMATTSYPNGYGHGSRTHNESVSLTVGERPSVKYNLRIRKLTSRECLRLMGWADHRIDKIQSCGVSQSQQYKQAGNGIVIQVLEAIFEQMMLVVRKSCNSKQKRGEEWTE